MVLPLVAAAAISAVISGLASSRAQKQQNAMLKYQAARERIQARLEKMTAEYELKKGEKEQTQIMIKGGKEKAAQKTAMAANGIRLSSRSAQNVMNETDYMTEVDRNQSAANALSAAWEHRIKATEHESNANMLNSQRQSSGKVFMSTAVKSFAQSMATGALMGAASSWLSSLGNVGTVGDIVNAGGIHQKATWSIANSSNIVNPSMNIMPKTLITSASRSGLGSIGFNGQGSVGFKFRF